MAAITPNATPTSRELEIITAHGGKLGRRVAPQECRSQHHPRTRCAECGNVPPFPYVLSDMPGTPLLLTWRAWYGGATPTDADFSTTTPEQRAEIEAATLRYQEAIAEVDRATGALIAAARAARARGTAVDEFGAPIGASPEFIARAEAKSAELEDPLARAEKKATAALRELNIVSELNPRARERLVRAYAGGERKRRLLVFA